MTELKRQISVVTDSSCDLPPQLLTRFKIAVVPLLVHFGHESYLDGELSAEAFWSKTAAVGSVPQTSRPSVQAFDEVFEGLVTRGKQVLCITLTGKHTSTIESAYLAAQRFGEAVQVFDSQSLSLGMGFQVLEAAQASERGRSMDEIVAMLEGLRSRVHALVVLDTLEYVRRGGRAQALVGVINRMSRLLNVKAIVNFVEGRVQLLGVARSFRRGVERVLDTVESLAPVEHLAVMHTQNVEAAEGLADRLAESLDFPRDRILVGETGSVVASHAGAGAVGVFAVSRRPGEGHSR